MHHRSFGKATGRYENWGRGRANFSGGGRAAQVPGGWDTVGTEGWKGRSGWGQEGWPLAGKLVFLEERMGGSLERTPGAWLHGLECDPAPAPPF